MKAKLWQALNAALGDAMRADPKVVLIGEDVGAPGGPYGISRGLLKEFGPVRVRDAPISEGALAGCAVGAAMLGLRPVVEIMFLDFISLALDQIVNNAAKYAFYAPEQGGAQKEWPLPLVICTLSGRRASMGPQHSQELEAWLCHVPGLKVAFPSTPQSAYQVLRTAIDDPGPVVVIHSIAQLTVTGELVTEQSGLLPAGKSRLVREGDDLTIVAYGPAVAYCEEAITKAGADAELIDLCWLQPWDKEAVAKSVERTSRLLIVHDAVEPFGVGAEIAAYIGQSGFWNLDAPITRVGADFSPLPVRKRDWERLLPDAERVASAIKELLGS